MEGKLTVRNSEAIRLQDIPEHKPLEFEESLQTSLTAGKRAVAYFGHRRNDHVLMLYAILADDASHELEVFKVPVENSFQSIASNCSQVHLFEREITEQFGVYATGHPWAKSVRNHSFSPSSADIDHPFFSIGGGQVHEVAVGPVHAGVIEPGHFRFQCEGEIVHHLEIQLGYQHRGIENNMPGGPNRRTLFQMETIAGDTSIGHATAYSQAVEALSGIQLSPRAQAIRALSLELERIANHVGDLGALANDIGFLPTASFCGRLRGDFLNITALICGSRLGRGLVTLGGVAFDIDAKLRMEILDRLNKAEHSVKSALSLFFDNQSVLSRLNGTGTLSAHQCIELGFVGPVARACGIQRDVRIDHPFGWYKSHDISLKTSETGDVYARALIRKMEIEESIAFVRDLVANLPEGPLTEEADSLQSERIVVSMAEGWRGEVAHIAITDRDGKFARYKIVDPSFHNWFGLALAMRGQQISDFPLCNKSFNLSYCGFDL